MSVVVPKKFDLIVVGGGHAGCEAALAGARMGANVCLISFSLNKLGALSCNPAIGGLAKGHLVKEVDALGGEIGKNTDAAGIQFRLLNKSRGPAVWSSRTQVDIDLYPTYMRTTCQREKLLWLLEAEVKSLIIKSNVIKGVFTLHGQEILGNAVVLTAGTFLRGVIHIGHSKYSAGRMGDFPSNALSDQMQELGFNFIRLKTGTTPRLDRRSIDFSDLDEQWGDEKKRFFSFMSEGKTSLSQVCCWVTHTDSATHEMIKQNLHKSPMYSGRITGTGARYCPSIEEKIVRFPDKNSHHIFLEPQGLNSNLIYPNGISTSLPFSVQCKIVRSLPGCQKAFIVRPGYAIEYNISDPQDLKSNLMSNKVRGLFLAGQINGTSGYEEAACQGFLAGINAILWNKEESPFILDRSQAYIGVLIDDLITKGTLEPYRMFTSRAEYRLSLREDNADLRLTDLGRKLGLVCDKRWNLFKNKQKSFEKYWLLLKSVKIKPTLFVNSCLKKKGFSPLRRPLFAVELLRRSGIKIKDISDFHESLIPLLKLDKKVIEQIEIKAYYAGYEKRQTKQIEQFRQQEKIKIPSDINYELLTGLSREVKEKLGKVRPLNLGQAGRIAGITPAAISVLSLYLYKISKINDGNKRL